MKSGVFIERDGILNLPIVDKHGQPLSPTLLADFQINPAALEPLTLLKQAGYLLLVTTNQPGLSRGYQSRHDLDLMHAILRRKFPIDDILVCPHDESDRCPCRKPNPGLLQEAAFKWHLHLDHSFVISDKWPDAQAAHVAGCTSILLKSPWTGHGHHDFILPDLGSVATKILQLQRVHSGWMAEHQPA